MKITIFLIMFILGTLFGSFFNVVGYRIPKGESIVYPSSHCPNCNHKLNFLDLVPIFSYIFLKGRCRYCHKKIKPFYTIFEFLTGLLFGLTYLTYGLTINMLVPLTFISLLIIIMVSDFNYLIISDEVLIFFYILLIFEILLIDGWKILLSRLLSSILAFLTMYLIKLLGDKLFKKESMGGGDIKLMAVFGLTLGYQNSLLSIFLASLIGLIPSLIIIKKKSNHIIPFGPLLSFGAIIIILTKIDLKQIITFLSH